MPNIKMVVITENRKRIEVKPTFTIPMWVTVDEPFLICYLEIDGELAYSPDLTPVEKMLLMGTMTVDNIESSDFRKAGQYMLRIDSLSGKKNLIGNETNFRDDFISYLRARSLPYTGIEHQNIQFGNSFSPTYCVFSFDVLVNNGGNIIPVKAGIPVYCNMVFSLADTVLNDLDVCTHVDCISCY